MKPTPSLIGFAAFVLVASVAAHGGAQPLLLPAQLELQAKLAAGAAAGEPLHSRESLRVFYAERGQLPAWSHGRRFSPQIDALVAALRSADLEGLNPVEYHTEAIAALRLRLGTAPPFPLAADGDAVDLDLLLSDAFFLYASHLTSGRVKPASVEPAWNIVGRGRSLVPLLATALEHGHLASTLGLLAPAREDYRLLRAALASQRTLDAAGGLPLVPPGPALREGERSARVAALRLRLAAGGDLPGGGDPAGELFDAPLAEALRRYQARHGLDADAIAGRRTLAQLNTPARQRARTIVANLERLRWLPRSLGARRLEVNIADFRLELIEPEKPGLEMRVIAGRQARRTPFFSGEITSVLLNPAWTVPLKIAVEDKLPLILADPDYLEEHGFTVFAPSGPGWREVDPATVDWASLSPERFPYRLRQEPGPGNALGRVKFQIPNRHDIYLHDTPSHELFARTGRSLSSGCIRVERAVDLAERLLAADAAWPRARIEATIESGGTVSVPLPEPLPVYLLYATAWVDRDGALQLRDDVYGSDAALLAALERPLTGR